MEKQKFLVTHEAGRTAVLAVDAGSAIDYLIEHPIPGAPEDYMDSAEVEEVTGQVYRVKADLKLEGMDGPIHDQLLVAAANPEEAKGKTRTYLTWLSWEHATNLSVEEVTEFLEA